MFPVSVILTARSQRCDSYRFRSRPVRSRSGGGRGLNQRKRFKISGSAEQINASGIIGKVRFIQLIYGKRAVVLRRGRNYRRLCRRCDLIGLLVGYDIIVDG